jgi:ubiquinone biosynthesis protein COQ4
MLNNTSNDPMPTDMLDLSAPERWRRALKALTRVMTNPDETDQVLLFVGYANAGTIARRQAALAGDAEWEQLYLDHPAIDSRTIDIPTMAALPTGTLGRAYADFLIANHLTPDVFDGPPAGVPDPRVAYAIQRMRQTHDLWHVITGHNTDFAGEIRLQAFTYAQLGAPASGILAAVGSVRGTRHHPALAAEALAAYRAGKRAKRFATYRYEDNWMTPLAVVRAQLNVTPASYPRLDLATAAAA